MARKVIKTRRNSSSDLTLKHTVELTDLRNKIKRARQAYFNSNEPIMSDEEYDTLESKLKSLNPNDKLLRQVGAPVTSKALRKVTLPYPMASLDKVKPNDTLKNWLKQNTGPYTLSDKLDGVSALLVYENAKYKMYTRGNGNIGTDITHLIPYVRGLPSSPVKNFKALRGELVFTKNVFAKKYAEQFKNARNLASGVVNSKDVSTFAKDLLFIVHSVVDPETNLNAAKNSLENKGFNVAISKTLDRVDEEYLLKYLGDRREKSKVDIDGIVVTTKSGKAVAFKAGYETGIGEVKNVEWRVTRFGYIKPTLTLRTPVPLSGASITRVTAHNAKYLLDNGVGIGAKIEIIRSGEVIPKILRTIKPSKLNPLPKNIKYKWNETNVDIVIEDKNESDESKVDLLVTFLIRIGVEKVKSSSISKLVEAGIDSIVDLVYSTTDDFVEAGLGPAIASHLESSLQQKLKLATIPALVAGCGLFDRGMGERKVSTILSDIHFKQQLRLYNSDRRDLVTRVSVVPGIGINTARQYVKTLPKFVKFLKEINWKPTNLVAPKVIKTGLGISPIVVFTGFRDKNLEAAIIKIGGSVGGSVTKNTTHVVTLNPKSNSVKITKARTYGSKIITPNELTRLLKDKR